MSRVTFLSKVVFDFFFKSKGERKIDLVPHPYDLSFQLSLLSADVSFLFLCFAFFFVSFFNVQCALEKA